MSVPDHHDPGLRFTFGDLPVPAGPPAVERGGVWVRTLILAGPTGCNRPAGPSGSPPAGSRRLAGPDPADRGDGGGAPAGGSAAWDGPVEPVCVSNERFATFVGSTGHVTDAERRGSSVVFTRLVAQRAPSGGLLATEWWREVPGADWRRPAGPGSSVVHRLDDPVVHVSWRDARAFCEWSGLRLPTESEWVAAASRDATGAPPGRTDPAACPASPADTGADPMVLMWPGPGSPGEGTGPSGGPCQVCRRTATGADRSGGTLWEWTADLFGAVVGHPVAGPGTHPATDPRQRCLRGGSYGCDAPHCCTARLSARMGNFPEFSSNTIGFRCAHSST